VCHLDQLLRLRLDASKATEFPFHESYKKWVEAKHRHYVIPLPEKQNIGLDDSDSSDSE